VTGEDNDVNLTLSNSVNIAPFILPISNATDPVWDTFKESFTNTSVSVTTDDSDLSYSISNSEKDGDFYAQAGFDGTIKNATTSEDLTMNSEIVLVYKLGTGVLQGARFNIDASGTVEGKTFDIKYDVEIFQEGFDLPAKTPSDVSGFEITSVFVGLILVIPYILKKRKNL